MVSRGRLILRGSTGGLPKNQSVACEARHAPTGPRAGRALYAHFQNTLAVLRALARRPSLCLSVFSVVSVFFVICGSPALCFVCLRGSSCPLCFPEKHSSFSQRLHLSRACRAFCSRGRFGASRLHAPFSVAVEGLARCACTLCSPGRRSRPFWGPF